MFLNTASPRRSFSIPININLQGARRRQTRELLQRAAAQEKEGSRVRDGAGERPLRTPPAVASIGEERAILLGFGMMAFSALMFFVVGIAVVKPHLNSKWEEEDSCVLLHTEILAERADCRGVSGVPCLAVTVNLSRANRKAFLHYDEESLMLMPKCFYIPKCQMDESELLGEALRVKSNLDSQLGSGRRCLADPAGHPGDVILYRKYTLSGSLYALLWPSLTLAGGALLVGLVKATQRLAHLSARMRDGTTGGPAMAKFYALERGSATSSPI
ncbi:calcium-activated potassium channel subunit beta-3 [Corythoichthys intestinalis]|uniref:calcium-activated potassium channel subunit beta-3 n=1 Tax=Corythoichthys intestinalis TaxID=161448 RepID=UPI0025A53F81|nr:calcium-activated potassium channel subunit beta-3 [Corythoichthys intestinalis]XP_061794923.1 calcium-activated potassium channel subunit beta-3-like [Nerophis lumbriciformis]